MLSITAVGNLASDPVQKETSQAGTKVTNFRLLTDIQDVTVQIDCTVWGNRGDVVMDYIKKGSQITVTGSGNLNTFEKRDGSAGASIQVRVVNDFTLPVRSRSSEAIPA